MDKFNEELLKLDNQVCFALYVASKEVIKLYRPLLEPLGLTYTGYITLLALWEKDGQSVKELGERLYLDSGTLTPVLKRLEEEGYVERIRGKEDERVVKVFLAEKGKSLKENAVCIPKKLLEGISQNNQDLEKLSKLLIELRELVDILKTKG